LDTARRTSTRYARPYRPPALRFANRLGRTVAAHRPSLSPEALARAAQRRNGLHDFGDTRFLHPLGVLVDSIEHEARLHPTGRLIIRERIVGVLGNRLRAHDVFTRRPEVLARAVAPLVVITGLQRTGTTLLHRMLGADPDTRVLASWEAVNPAPLPGRLVRSLAGPGRRRMLVAALSELSLRYMAPDFFAVHPVEADAPEEESVLMDFTFLSPVSEAILRVPTYAAWLRRQDARPAYEYLGSMLKLLQWQRPARRWALKTPHHMGYLDVLLDVFPGTRVIQTHRDPAVTLASFCSMVAHARGVFSDRVDPEEIGREWLEKQATMVTRAMRVRDGLDGDHVLDVHYADLVSDPMAQLERVYDFAGLRLEPAAADAARRALGSSPRHRHGRHVYSLSDFGLDPAVVRRHFDAYCTRHAVDREAG
jgi:hypothetical protein